MAQAKRGLVPPPAAASPRPQVLRPRPQQSKVLQRKIGVGGKSNIGRTVVDRQGQVVGEITGVEGPNYVVHPAAGADLKISWKDDNYDLEGRVRVAVAFAPKMTPEAYLKSIKSEFEPKAGNRYQWDARSNWQSWDVHVSIPNAAGVGPGFHVTFDLVPPFASKAYFYYKFDGSPYAAKCPSPGWEVAVKEKLTRAAAAAAPAAAAAAAPAAAAVQAEGAVLKAEADRLAGLAKVDPGVAWIQAGAVVP